MSIRFVHEELTNTDYWVMDDQNGIQIAAFFGMEAERNAKIFENALNQKLAKLRMAADLQGMQ